MAAPTVISVVEKSFDTSIFYSVSEEENKINETLKVFEAKLFENDKFTFSVLDRENEKSYISYIKNYTSKDLECLSPPPELG